MTKAKEHIWVIGASTGIGAALAKELAGNGHSIALSARNRQALAHLHEQLPQNDHLVVPLDVSDPVAVKNAMEVIREKWTEINRVIFMAGVYQPMQMDQLDLSETKKILEINLLGAFYVTEAVLPELLSKPGRQLVFCASVAGYRGLPKAQPYGASKAGLINMVESIRAEQGNNLDIKLINPGFVESRLTDKNHFHMPSLISAEKAAKEIVNGLNSSGFEIHFPKRFTLAMKLLSLLPNWIYYRIIG